MQSNPPSKGADYLLPPTSFYFSITSLSLLQIPVLPQLFYHTQIFSISKINLYYTLHKFLL